MRALDRKLIADMRRLWGPCLAISVVLACGVSTFIMSSSMLVSLVRTRDAYYRDYRFAHVFVRLKRAPQALATQLRAIPGVAQVETRIIQNVLLDLPGMSEPATAQLISLPDDPRRGLNLVHLRVGRYPNPFRPHEVVVNEAFAEAHGLRPGDSLHAVFNGRRERLSVVGIGLSPEYVYAVPPGQLLPNDRSFGVFWMAYRQIAASFDKEGAFDGVTATLQSAAREQEVIQHLDRLTARYGGLGAYGREDQVSHRRLSDELMELRSMAWVAPLLFLGVAAFLFYMVLSRTIQGQREEIALLKAFGYTRWEIGAHYAKFIAVLVGSGFVLGTVAGCWLGYDMSSVYQRFFRFPELTFQLSWPGLLVAVLLTVGAASVGGWSAVWQAVRLPPAEAMKPETPQTYEETWWNQLTWRRWLTPVGLMIVRRIERHRMAAFFSVLGIALAEAVLVLGMFVEDTVEYVLDIQLQQTQRQDVTLTFIETTSEHVLHDVRQLPGVLYCEPLRAVAVRLRSGRRARRLGVLGMTEQPRLLRVLGNRQQPVDLSGSGLILSTKLAELLDVELGDTLTLEVLEGDRPIRRVRVERLFPDYTEPVAYMNRWALHRLLREGPCLTGAFVTIDAAQRDAFHRAVKEAPRIAAMASKQAALDAFRSTMGRLLLRMRTVNIVFAGLIAAGVIYNCARITFAERRRELATMRVLGFTQREVAVVLQGELAVLGLVALPVGLMLGYLMSYVTVLSLDTESHRFPLVIDRSTYAYAASGVILALLISSQLVRRMLAQLDLIAVVKSKE